MNAGNTLNTCEFKVNKPGERVSNKLRFTFQSRINESEYSITHKDYIAER